MSKIDKILVPTDFSSAAESAVTYANNFTEGDGSIEITLLYISESPLDEGDQSALEVKLHALKDRFLPALKSSCQCVVRSGSLTETILTMQKETGADLIIMGTKGASEEGEPAISRTSELVLEADCAVLVVPENTGTFTVQNIALALGKNEIDDSFALGTLHDVARKFGAKVHILTINNEEGAMVTEDKNESILEYYLETLHYHHVFPKNTDIEKGIFDYVREKNIDMLAILPRNHAKKSKPSEGRLTRLLTLHTEVPLLTID